MATAILVGLRLHAMATAGAENYGGYGTAVTLLFDAACIAALLRYAMG